jgi:uncharacterized protein YjiS (DUF1127 family)
MTHSTTLSGGMLGQRLATPVISPAWVAVRPAVARWLARLRFTSSIAHLDDRLLADAGLTPRNLGLAEHLVRYFAAGGEVWSATERVAR